jgi:signal transduction histidine kinase
VNQKLNILFLDKDEPDKGFLKAIDNCVIDSVINIKSDFDSFLSSHDLPPDLIIFIVYNKMKAIDLLTNTGKLANGFPVVLVVPEDKISPELFHELMVAGAYGIMDSGTPASVSQYLTRVALDLGLERLSRGGVNSKLLQFIVDSNDSMISVINDELKYEVVNVSFCKNLECSYSDMIGSSPSKLWGDETFKEIIETNLRKSLKGEIVKYKAYFEKEGFTGKCYEVIYRPYLPGKGTRSYSIVETKDITELENVKKMVERSDLRNFYIEKFLPFGVFDCNIEGQILFANETFYTILDVPVNNRRELSINQFFPNDKRFSEYLKSINEGESSTFSQLQMITYKGDEMFARISSHARFDRDSGIIVDCILEDATREVLLERKLGRSHRMETLGTLAGGIAHDFNTILTTISGYSELTMEEVDKTSDVYDYMSKVNQAIKKAESVINQMLTFSRQVDLEKVPVEIVEVVKEATDFMRSAIPYNIYMETEVAEPGLEVLADPTQLFRVFLNIMTNSVQAMEEAGGVLKVQLKTSESSDKQFVDILISDTGSGIEKSIIDRIYEPFFTTKEVGKGSGMGLSVAHGVISGLGGELNVESTVGEGTTFFVRLPLIVSGVEFENHQKDDDLLTVVYADENIYFSRTVSIALEKLGYRVILVSSIGDMNLMFDNERPDIDIYFIRCGFSGGEGSSIIQRIIDDKSESRVVLITKPGSEGHHYMVSSSKKRIRIINEPVSLREILSAIKDIC